MAKRINDDDLIVISGGIGFHVTPEPQPDPGTTDHLNPVAGRTPGGPGPGPVADGSSSGNQNLTK